MLVLKSEFKALVGADSAPQCIQIDQSDGIKSERNQIDYAMSLGNRRPHKETAIGSAVFAPVWAFVRGSLGKGFHRVTQAEKIWPLADELVFVLSSKVN